jgi:hypothetical protein
MAGIFIFQAIHCAKIPNTIIADSSIIINSILLKIQKIKREQQLPF